MTAPMPTAAGPDASDVRGAKAITCDPTPQHDGVIDTDSLDIQKSLAGDQDAFARLVEKYETPIANLMWRFSRDANTCEELVQDVFVEAYLSLATYHGSAPLLHWLRRIATRVGYKHWRRKAKAKTHTPLRDDDIVVQPEDASDPSAAAELLHRLLARLKPAERLVLTLHYFEQCSHKDIAERMGWTTPMVKMRAMRARQKLKEIARKEHLLETLQWTP